MVNTMTNAYAAKVAETITDISGWKCEVKEIRKNNASVTGIIIHKDEGNIAPTVYIPDSIANLTWDDLSEDDIEDAACEFIEAVNRKPAPSGAENIGDLFSNKPEILKRVIFCLVNRIWNEGAELVSRPVDGDLQYIYKVDVSDIVGENSTITIKPEHLERVNVTEEELYIAALKNTQEKRPVVIKDMSEMFGGIPMNGGLMYVVSNDAYIYGAAAITYPGVAERLKDLLGDFVILPSSVHECIAVSAQDDCAKEFCDMVREVNRSAVEPHEQLADHIYKFDDEGKLVSINE